MEELAHKQDELGKILQEIIKNFKKDTASRKTRTYYKERLRRLEEAWKKFDATDTAIRELPGAAANHPYFTTQYYDTIAELYKEYKSYFSAEIENVEPEFVKSDTKNTLDEASVSNENKSPNLDAIRKLRRQKEIVKAIERILSGLDFEKQSNTYYELRLKQINHYWEQIEDLNQAIWELVDEPSKINYDVNEYLKLEEAVQDTLLKLTEKRDYKSNAATGNGESMANLPKITIPKFDGNHLHWRQFYDLFCEMVHKQPIAPCQKMWYLKTNLIGEAEKLIRHLTVSEENYILAWNMLKDRYENARLLVNAQINKLLSQPIIVNESAYSIKLLHDTTHECILALESLGVSTDSWDPILLHLLIKRLDVTTHRLYEQTLKEPKKLQRVKEFLVFLETRFQSLEALGSKAKPIENNNNSRHSKSSSLTASILNNCIACKGNHPLYSCRKFLQSTTDERLQLVKEHKLCFNCLKVGHRPRNCTYKACIKCDKKHNTLLHIDRKNNQTITDTSIFSENRNIALTAASIKAQQTKCDVGYVLLSTAIVKLTNSKGVTIECRAILDSGSQLNFVTERVIKKLGLSSSSKPIKIEGIGKSIQNAHRRVNVLMSSKHSNYSARVEAIVLPQIIADQPIMQFETSGWNIPKNITLADPKFNIPSRIDMLLGAEFYHSLLCAGKVKLSNNLPILNNSVFGWIVSGKIASVKMEKPICGVLCRHENFDIEKFWKMEEVETHNKILTREQDKCEQLFYHTLRRDASGRFIVRLPFRDSPDRLGSSKEIALRRFFSIEKKLGKDATLKEQYTNFMNEYIQLGHMSEVRPEVNLHGSYFLPHHGVVKPDSLTTKLRVVFDASAKTSSNVSLNDILFTGPTLQDDLFSILLRFRLHKFVFSADVEKMYRQILVNEEDRRYQLILWRSDPKGPVKTYQLNTVTYGTTPASYLATKCLQRLAQLETSRYPQAAEAMVRDFYVDDILTGADKLSTALIIQHQLNELLEKGGFKLRKWCSNHPALMQNIPPEHRAIQLDFADETEEQIKTLGLVWIPKSDIFSIRTNVIPARSCTKRNVSSDIARLFDPLGIIGPVIVTAKIILQQLWLYNLEWDDILPSELQERWTLFRENLHALKELKIPRHVFGQDVPRSIQIHGFADASEKAYGGAIYIRSTNSQNMVVVRLLCSKSKVAPLKKLTLPRLELCAAKLLAELIKRVKHDLKLESAQTFFWTDSQIVLDWIHSQSSSFHTFVANRIAAIQELSLPHQWRHVGSRDNPADILSRGVAPNKLKESTLWFYGPHFLHGAESIWPAPYHQNEQCELEKRRAVLSTVVQELHQVLNPASSLSDPNKGEVNIVKPSQNMTQNDDEVHFLYRINHRNSFKSLQRVTAYILRFVKNIKSKCKKRFDLGNLTMAELNEGLNVIVKLMQEQEFSDELKQLMLHKQVANSSQIITLNPFLDEYKIIRVGGRLEGSALSFNAKHPILLPYGHPFTKMLMTDIHIKNKHVGPQTLLAVTRQQFWPIKGKSIARSIVQHCVRCVRARPKMLSQVMGNLPSHRVQPARPFIISGVDFCGPIWIHYCLRGKRPQKAYIAVFCCFSTKAVHLEVVSNLSTDAFIACLKRFIGRRGNCKTLYCDNATNFVGAKNQLQELKETLFGHVAKEMISAKCSEDGIDFKFIPPRAPHFGGLWEAAVKSAKHLLQRSLVNASLTYEELETVVIEIEAILNSRPLTYLPSDPNDPAALTPGHFLIGEPLTTSIDTNATPLKTTSLKRWSIITDVKAEFWKRWSKEYLNELQHRYKWKTECENVQPGTIVVIHDDNTSPQKWPLGRIVKTFKGKDGFVRVADIKTAGNILKRPIHKIAPLPIEVEVEHRGVNNDQPTCNIAAEERPTTIRRAMSPERSETASPKKKMRHSLSSMLMTLLCVTCTIFPSSAQEIERAVVSQFSKQVGLYFEKVGEVNFVTTEWNLIIYYDLKPYWREYDSLINGTKTLDHLCQQLSQGICGQLVHQFKHTIQELGLDNVLFSKRQKRGAFNIVGRMANSLFGVLDSSYAKHMKGTISKVIENEDYLLQLAKNQTSVIDSTMNIMKRNQQESETKFKEFSDQVDVMIKRIRDNGDEAYRIKIYKILTSLSIQMAMITSNLRKTQSTIIATLTDTHHGTINPILFTPQQLQQEVAKIKLHLPESTRLPMAEDDLIQMYRAMTVKSGFLEDHLIFEIKLPLMDEHKFDVLKVLPIPMAINNSLVAISPCSAYLAINLHRDQYLPLAQDDLAKCTIIKELTYLCTRPGPVYRKGSQICSCEVNLFNNETQRSCVLTKVNDQWTQLQARNQWLYAVKTPTQVNLICGRDVSRLALDGSGLLTLRSDCVIKHESYIIKGRRTYASNFSTSYSSLAELDDVLEPRQLENLVANTTVYHSHVNEILELQNIIKNQRLAELPNKRRDHRIHHLGVGYAALSLGVFLVGHLVWRNRTRICKVEKKPIPSPRRRTTPNFEVDI